MLSAAGVMPRALPLRRLRPPLAGLALGVAALGACDDRPPAPPSGPDDPAAALDAELRAHLDRHGFTGRVAATLERRLGRSLDPQLADLGRLLFFDPIHALNDDNSCAGCHSPTAGLGDTQPIAIGIDNNGLVGPARQGPRNQRRSPTVANTALYPTLMWNSRFHSPSRDAFDHRTGFELVTPEGRIRSFLPHLLTAQAFVPPVERVEAAGFHFQGGEDAIRGEVLRRLNASAEYRALFGRVFPHVRAGAPIAFADFARAIAEFEFTQVYANAPIDRYARGDREALTAAQKRGAALFFGRAGCVACHAVAGASNEMFSDFRQHVAGVPQVVPASRNVVFDGPGADEDFGLEQVTGDPADRYAFRTSPLRNVGLQPAFMHNGAFVRLDDAIRYHLDATRGAAAYDASRLPADLRGPAGPLQPVLDRLDPRLRAPVVLTEAELAALVEFVGIGLLDPEARPERLRRLIPARLPSGRAGLRFEP